MVAPRLDHEQSNDLSNSGQSNAEQMSRIGLLLQHGGPYVGA